MSNSSIVYNGPSMIDGSPIVVIALVSTSNRKTGSLVQTYILRSDMHPMTASKQGLDYSICGDCKHRGTPTDNPGKKQAENRSCYVTLFQGPSQVYKAFKRGTYPDVSQDPEHIASIGSGRMVRLGTYGDPAAAPGHVWLSLLRYSKGSTGYTHHTTGLAPVAPLGNPLMVSTDTIIEARQAQAKGYRTFRVIPVSEWKQHGRDTVQTNEVLCPASSEGAPASGKVTCEKCKLCNGNSGKATKSIAIVAHGIGRKYVETIEG